MWVASSACGVCHTDLHFLEGLLEPGKIPLTLGHEVAGEIAEAGERVKEFQKGDRVVTHFYFTCGDCYYCQSGSESLCARLTGHMGFTVDGGYAEYVKAPARSLSRLPRVISFDEGGILADAVSSTFHAVRSVVQVRAGESVVVYGLGGLGVHAVQIARLCGARVIGVDIVEEKLAMARELGADDTVNPSKQDVLNEVKGITGEGADVVLEFVGLSDTMKNSIACLRRKGRLVFVGYSQDRIPTGAQPLVTNALQILGSRASSRYELSKVISLASRHRIRPVILEDSD